jgi:hypothetical protein
MALSQRVLILVALALIQYSQAFTVTSTSISSMQRLLASSFSSRLATNRNGRLPVTANELTRSRRIYSTAAPTDSDIIAAPAKQKKYIVVTGGVISGIGKGVTSSSIGVILKMLNIRPTAIKIDPYLNVDAGTMSPFEHGEV